MTNEEIINDKNKTYNALENTLTNFLVYYSLQIDQTYNESNTSIVSEKDLNSKPQR